MTELEQLQENSLKPVGTVFNYKGVELVIEEGDECCLCYLHNKCDNGYEAQCLPHCRPDKKDVIYTQVK